MKKSRLLLIFFTLFLLTSCKTSSDGEISIDWDNPRDQIIISDNIFIGKIIQIEDVYYYDNDDTKINSTMPVTHFKVEIIYSLKGIEQGIIIDYLLFAGFNENNVFEGYDFITKLPLIDEVYLFYTLDITESHLDADSRMIDGAVQNFGRPQNLVLLVNYVQSGDTTDWDDNLRDLINGIESDIEEYKDILKDDILFD